MKKNFLVVSLISLSFSSAVFANASCGETTLHGYMEEIREEMRLMSTDIRSGNNDLAASRTLSLITYFEKSRNETPYKFTSENMQGSRLANQMSEYTTIIDNTIVTLKNLETALNNNASDEVRRLLGEVGAHRGVGHRAFKANC